jgi:two-component system chemotaxis family response regulator WspR
MSIVLIEDDPDAASHLSSLLGHEGYREVTVAGTFAEAIQVLEPETPAPLPELVLVDLLLPDGNGLDLCRRLKESRRFANIPILVVSSVDDECTIEECLDAGARDYLRKPVRPRELAARLRAALRDRRHDEPATSRERELLSIAEGLRKSNEELRRLSDTDPLTGVANRRQFNIVYRNEWRRASRGSLAMALAFFDVDDFHAFNERYGHVEGDQCLVAIAHSIAATARRPADLFARYGGEEFVFVLPDTDLEGARVVAERARQQVEALHVPHERSRCSPYVTVSAGVASIVPRTDLSPDMLLSIADDALLRAKTRGRNRVEVPDQPRATGTIDAPITVAVDPVIARRIPTFLANRRQDVRVLLEAIDHGVFDSIRRVGHNLKGTGASFGFDLISTLGRTIEDGALAKDVDKIRGAIDELSRYLDQVQVVAPPTSGGR